MRFMMLVKADAQSEAGALPDERLLSEMAAFNESMVKAGVMLAGDGLKPSSHGVRVRCANDLARMIQYPATSSLASVKGPSVTVTFPLR